MKKLSVVIPTLNEEKGVVVTINRIPFDELKKKGYSVEVLVVDSNSKDRTVELAKKNGAKVVIESRLGYGRAYKTGFENSKGDIIVTFLAVLEMVKLNLVKVVQHVQTGIIRIFYL